MSTKTPKDVLALAASAGAKFADLRFVDFPGTQQHFTVPISQFVESSFTDGFGFDGSSIRGWQAINESDMLVIPDPATAFIDPFFEHPTLVITADIQDPISRQAYSRDPRHISRKAEQYLLTTGIADTAYFGPEAEFFVFDDIRYKVEEHSSFFAIDSDEAFWNTDQPGIGHKNRVKEGYFPVPPSDSLQDLRSKMVLVMESLGIEVECHHHEVASPGQCEIDMRFGTLTKMADQLLLYKYIVKNVASRAGKAVTFMPKPLFGDNGSGMHTHQSLWRDGKPLFAGDKYAGLSEMALHYIGGLLKHSKAILAFAAPTTNSYKRLVPGYEAPVNLVYSSRNRSAAVRIPMYSNSPKAKRVEYRPPDPSANPYLAFSAMLMAGLDGIKNKIHPGEPIDKDIYHLSEKEARRIASVPGSLTEALAALEKDHAFLLEGGVFTKDVIDTHIEYRRAQALQLQLRPHPYEFHLYSDV